MKQKTKKKLLMPTLLFVILVFTGCAGGADYKTYRNAYQKMSEAGSMDADISLNLKTSDDEVKAEGNMKMNRDGLMYYEMKVGDTEVIQFTKGDKLYSSINGQKTVYSTSGESNEKPKPDGGNKEKEEGSGFNVNSFMEEFAAMLEAGKIKEMGLFDPIPQASIKSLKVEKTSDGKDLTLVVPDSFVEKLFNVMIKEQVSDEDYALSFSNLKNFECRMHINSEGILSEMTYSGNTDVTVPAALAGEEEVMNMDIKLSISLNNPGQSVEVPQPDTDGYE